MIYQFLNYPVTLQVGINQQVNRTNPWTGAVNSEKKYNITILEKPFLFFQTSQMNMGFTLKFLHILGTKLNKIDLGKNGTSTNWNWRSTMEDH